MLRDVAEDSLLLQSRSPIMRALLEDAKRAANSGGTILLTGESGSGKSMLAKQIHQWSPRRAQPFTVINCLRLYQEHREAERSSWYLDALQTGAQLGPEWFELSHGGTLFLASIEDLPLALQADFARFVEYRRLETPEGQKPIDLRIIAASNRDLAAEVQMHRFREDLFYGLDIISLRVPPLRERPADILALAARMLVRAAVRNHRAHLRLSQDAATALTRYHWPGNIRELRNAMEVASVLCEGRMITPANLPEALSKPAPEPVSPKARLDQIEREHIALVLAESPSLKQAATTLGINVSTLWRKRTLYNLEAVMGWKFRRMPK